MALPPPLFLERMQSLLGDDFAPFARSLAGPSSSGLRANTLKIAPPALASSLPFALQPLPGLAEGFTYEMGQPGKHPYHAAGLYYLQDPSAMRVGQVVDAQPGERVLDLSAAPGGKATHLASLLRGSGLLAANEIHPRRAWELAENLERWEACNALILQETPERLAQALPEIFDRVLLDAPCSGEGMFRKSEAARRAWTPDLPAACALRQEHILESAARLARPGGWLVYSTCTFNPAENEAVLASFLSKHPEFELEEISRLPGDSPGRPDWVPGASNSLHLERMLRLWPHKAPGDGHCIAKLHKSGGSDVRCPQAWEPPAPSNEARRLWKDFVERSLAYDPVKGKLAQVGGYLYAITGETPNLSGLRAIHPGWWLGEIKKERLVPAHALALGLPAEAARHSLALNLEQAAAYLRGGTFPQGGQDGWVLVTVDGFPLGWGRRVQGLVKNLYPKGLRWL